MPRLDTKQKRLEARRFYAQEGAQTIDMPEIQLQAFTSDPEGDPKGRQNHFTLTVFTGTAGKPSINYYYRTREARDAALQKAIADQKSRLDYKAQYKAENKGHQSGAAVTAAVIRARLKNEFPGIKFSVRSENFSGGNSVDIDWTDGPRTSDVDAVCRQYQYGYFDGMTDCYEYRDIAKDLGCPGAKYVHSHRTLTDEYKTLMLSAWDALHDADNYRPREWERNTWRMVNDIERQHPELMPYQYERNQRTEELPEEVTETASATVTQEATQEGVQEVVQEESKRSNVIDITARLKAKREHQEASQAVEIFKRDYLPHIKKSDVDLLINSPKAELGNTIAKICLRIDLEKSLK